MVEMTTAELFAKMRWAPKFGQRPTVNRDIKAILEASGIESHVMRRGARVERVWIGEQELWDEFITMMGDEVPRGYIRNTE